MACDLNGDCRNWGLHDASDPQRYVDPNRGESPAEEADRLAVLREAARQYDDSHPPSQSDDLIVSFRAVPAGSPPPPNWGRYSPGTISAEGSGRAYDIYYLERPRTLHFGARAEIAPEATEETMSPNTSPDDACERCGEGEDPEEEDNEEGFASFVSGAFYGDFADNNSWSAMAGQIAVGFTPLGVVGDIRDTAAAIRDVAEGREGAGLNLGMAIIGFIPGGDILKSARRVGGRVTTQVDDLADVVRRTELEDAIDDGLRQLDGPGEEVFVRGERLDLAPYGSRQRQARHHGVHGQGTHEAMHPAPQSVLKNLPQYNPRHALTVLYDKDKHRAFDRMWKDDFNELRRQGRTDVTTQEVFDIVSRAIDESGSFEPGIAESMKHHLQDELFNQMGLSNDSLLRLPGYN